MDVIGWVEERGLIAVVRGDSAEKVLCAVDALASGGVDIIEITLTNEKPLWLIEQLASKEGILVGAGTVLNLQQAKDAVSAGARFIVSPCLVPDVIRYSVDARVAAMPGVFTPTEVHQALELGASVLKLFPGSSGGTEHLKALRGPFPKIRVVPTGGVDRSNIKDWFAAGAIAVGLGGNLASKADIAAEDYATIMKRAEEYSGLIRDARS